MASSVAYCSDIDVKTNLPRSYNTTSDLPDSSDTSYISLATRRLRASRWVDTQLGIYYCQFNAYDHSTYPTPATIRDLTAARVCWVAYRQLAVADRNSEYGGVAQEWREETLSTVASLLNVADPTVDTAPGVAILDPETVTSETLTFGGGGTYDIDSQSAFINVQSNLTSGDIPVLIPESVKVTTSGLTQYNFGRDFSISFNPQHRRWMLTDRTGVLTDASTITYQWTWRRYDEVQRQTTAVGFMGGF